MANTYTKLRSGAWGVRVDGSATAGQSVVVQTKAGATKQVTIGTVVWSGNGVSLCSIAADSSSTAGGDARRNRYTSSGKCRECRGPIRHAAHHRAMGGLCGDCAFDEYDC